MAATQTEDAASVLDSFVHDVANLPAETAHLLEELQAKDEQIALLRSKIHEIDVGLQRHVRQKGALVKHEKEDLYMQQVSDHYARAHILQEEKISLANKAALLLDRHVKRLDLKVRDLQSEGTIGLDPTLPSLLQHSDGNRVGPASATSTGVNTPLHPHQHPLAHAAGSLTHMANTAMAQMLNRVAHQNNMSASAASANSAPAAAMQPHPLLGNSQRHREMSASSDGKRRRLNGSMGPTASTAASSALARHSSLGPGASGTPKAGTPTAGSRAGSAGPARTKKAGQKKVPPHMAALRRKMHGGRGGNVGSMSKKSARRLMAGKKGTPSSTGDDDDDDSGSGGDSDGESTAAADRGRVGSGGMQGKDGAADQDDAGPGADDDGEDTNLYCFCQTVSHGNMVACDNEKCRFEWFHMSCVGMTQEPEGRWLCDECKKLPEKKIKYAR